MNLVSLDEGQTQDRDFLKLKHSDKTPFRPDNHGVREFARMNPMKTQTC